MTDVVGARSLKLIAVASSDPSLVDAIEATLRARAGEDELRRLCAGTFVVYTDAQPETVRRWLAPLLRDEESMFVVEFDRWSGYGAGIDSRWLMVRGH